MKNLVISKKGFDATGGGHASPIFANGDIFLFLSLKKSNRRPDIGNYNSMTCLDMNDC